MRILVKSILALSLLGLGMSAKGADPGKEAEGKKNTEACVFVRSVDDWRALDDTNLVVWATGNNKQPYHVKLIFPLTGLRFDHTMAFVDGDQDGRLCGYGRDSLAERATNPGAQKSSITSIARLDAAGVAALETKYKVSLSREKGKKQIPATPEGETAK